MMMMIMMTMGQIPMGQIENVKWDSILIYVGRYLIHMYMTMIPT